MRAVILALFLWLGTGRAFELIAQESLPVIVNGGDIHTVYSATWTGTNLDFPGRSGFVPPGTGYSVQGDDGTQYSLQFSVPPPTRKYTVELLGYVPSLVYLHRLLACLTSSPGAPDPTSGNPSVDNTAYTPRSFINRAVQRELGLPNNAVEQVNRFGSRDAVVMSSNNFDNSPTMHEVQRALRITRRGLVMVRRSVGSTLEMIPIIGPILSNIFGGGDDTSKLWDAIGSIQNTIGVINGAVQSLGTFANAMTKWTRTANDEINLLIKNDGLYQNQFNSIRANEGLMERQIRAVGSFAAQLATNMSADFREVGAEIGGGFAFTGQVWNASRQIMTMMERQISRLSQSVTNQALLTRQIVSTIYRVAKDEPMSRILRQGWHREKNNPILNITTVPYVQSQGLAPLSPSERRQYSCLKNATIVSRVHIQYTRDNVAYDDAISFACDSDFLLNNTMPGTDIQTMKSLIGFPNCTGRTSSDTTVWNCTCILRRETTTRSVTGDNVFPFNYNHTTNLAALTASELGVAGVHRPVTEDTHIFTSASSFSTWFTTLCKNTLASADASAVSGTTGKKVRFISDSIDNSLDLDLVIAGMTIDDICNTQFGTYQDGGGLFETPGFVFDQIQAIDYGVWNNYGYAALEQRYYGVGPTDVKYEGSPFSRRPELNPTYRCEELTWASVLDTPGTRLQTCSSGENMPHKIPMYRYTMVNEYSDFTLRVAIGTTPIDSGIVYTTASNDTSPTHRIPTTSGVNITVGTTVTSSSQWNVFLPGRFYVLGDLTGNAFPNMPRCRNKQYVWDMPFTLFGEGMSAASRAGAIDYIYEPYDASDPDQATKPLNPKAWVSAEGVPFDPAAAAESAHRFMKIVQLNGDKWQCDSALDETGTEHTGIALNSLCEILQYFSIDVVDPPNQPAQFREAIIRPYQYKYQMSSRVPGGKFIQRINSKCPPLPTVNVTNTGFATVTFRATFDTQLSYYEQTSDPFCATQGSTSFVVRANLPTILTFPDCGEQLMFVTTYDGFQCYPGGIELDVNSAGGGGPAIPTPVENRIIAAQDDVVATLRREQSDLTQLVLQTQLIRQMAPDIASANAAIQAAFKKKIDALNNSTFLHGDAKAAADQMIADLNDLSGQVQANIADQIGNATIAAADVVQLKNDSAQQVANLAAVNASNVAVQAANAALQQAVDDMNAQIEKDRKGPCDQNRLGPFSFLEKGACHLMGSLFGGLFNMGGPFGQILTILFWLLLIGGSVYCCGPACMRAIRKRRARSAAADESTASTTTAQTKSRMRVQAWRRPGDRDTDGDGMDGQDMDPLVATRR